MKLVIISTIFVYSSLAMADNKYNSKMKKSKISDPQQLIGPSRDDEEFLRAISMLESSQNTNTDHKIMDSGIHAGDSAVGEFGIMPNTVRELAKRLKRRDHRLQLDSQFKGDPEIERFADPKIPQNELQQEMLNNPEIANRAARYMHRLVETRFQDPDKMAYAWHNGHNTDPEKLSEDVLSKNEYVQRFRKLRNSVKQK